MLYTLIVILVISAIFSYPRWPHSNGWGYYPSGGIGVIIAVILILWLFGRL